eukprot:3699081-Amphidinium_carterae.1
MSLGGNAKLITSVLQQQQQQQQQQHAHAYSACGNCPGVCLASKWSELAQEREYQKAALS